MKIIVNNVTKDAVAQKTGQAGKPEAGKFEALLREAVEEKKTSGSSPAQNLSAPATASPIDTAMLLSLDTTKIIDGAERLVGALEEFQTKLANTSITLEDLSPIIEKMDREKNLLLPSLEALPQADPLRGVLNNVLITCSVEAEKFKRGDYL